MKSLYTEKNEDSLLVVTNRDDLACAITEALAKEKKIKFHRARSVIEALSYMTFSTPNIIVADIELPGLSGLDLLRSVRRNIKTKLIPVILVGSDDRPKDRIEAVKAGSDALIIYPFIKEEFSEIIRSRLQMFKEFYLLTITDELTRLYNRREFIKKFNAIISADPDKTLSLAILDIDHFKLVNDRYGHQVGDRVLMRLADLLKKKTSEKFFPARFGGEEFIILFSDHTAEESVEEMQILLSEFSGEDFEIEDHRFHVTFSAGVSQYPLMASNISELLSRGDQALYAAKEDGRNRIYTFSPIMSHNDTFWDYLRLKKGLFIDDRNFEAVTHLPYTPQLLEIIANLEFDVKDIGVFIIKLIPIMPVESFLSTNNYQYDIENIKNIIKRSCELVFPSDTFMGLSDFYNYEFCVLFPSVINFSINPDKFREICGEISSLINQEILNYNYDISYSSDVVSLDKANPRLIFKDLQKIEGVTTLLSEKHETLANLTTAFQGLTINTDISKLLQLKNFYHIKSFKPIYQYLCLFEPFEHSSILSAILNRIIQGRDGYNLLIKKVHEQMGDQIIHPLMIPYIPVMPLDDFINITASEIKDKPIIICIDEKSLQSSIDDISPHMSKTPDNISFAVDNSYISNQILNFISNYDFSTVLFSENITRRLYMHKNRIKIISGLKIFLEQVGVMTLAKNVASEEEFQIIRDLKINGVSGDFAEKTSYNEAKLALP